MNKRYKIFVILLILISGCAVEKSSLIHLQSLIFQLKSKNAPDKRVAIFDVVVKKDKDKLVLSGESNLPAAVAELRDSLYSKNISFVDSVKILPAEELNGKIYAVVNLSVANFRSQPQHSAELSTQATLGTPMKVLKKERGWYLVQTPDKYISWLDWGGLQLMSAEDFALWMASKKLIYLKPFGFSYKSPLSEAATIADLVMGDIIELTNELKNFYEIKYPNGTIAYIPKNEAMLYQEWLQKLNPSETSVVETAFGLNGFPYLWGGTSFKGVDCSGFTKTVYFMNGMVIPRDASQQIHTGELIDDKRNFKNLRPGDLLFFGRPATDSSSEKVVHVGIWIGNNEFIHASGDVHVSSMDSTSENFDQYNYDRYLRTKRLLNQEDERLIQLKENPIF